MNQNLQKDLFRRYPHFFRKRRRSEFFPDGSVDPFDLYGITCGDGWFDLIDQVSANYEALIELLIAQGVPQSECPRAARIKEKLGRLRIQIENWQFVPETLIAETTAIEDRSELTCETCGKPATRNGEGPDAAACGHCVARAPKAEAEAIERQLSELRRILGARAE